MLSVVLAMVDIAIGIYLVFFLRKRALYDRKSLLSLSLFALAGGLLAIAVTLLGGAALNSIGLYKDPSFLDYFIFTGPLEESSKFFAFVTLIFLFRIRIKEPIDSITYIGCVALGFSLIENLLYALRMPILIGLRSFTSTPMHIVFSSIVGFAFAQQSFKNKRVPHLLRALLLASLAHGLYDAVVTSGIVSGYSYYLFLFLFINWGRRVLSYTLLISPRRRPLSEFVRTGTSGEPETCLVCADIHPHSVFITPIMTLKECGHCHYVTLPSKLINRTLNYFIPFFKLFFLKDEDFVAKFNSVLVEFFDNSYDSHRKFKLPEVNDFIEATAMKMRLLFEKSRTFNFIYPGS